MFSGIRKDNSKPVKGDYCRVDETGCYIGEHNRSRHWEVEVDIKSVECTLDKYIENESEE